MKALKEAAEYAAGVLARVDAFGDSIGPNVTKAEMGVALRGLRHALQGVEPMPSDCAPVVEDISALPNAQVSNAGAKTDNSQQHE